MSSATQSNVTPIKSATPTTIKQLHEFVLERFGEVDEQLADSVKLGNRASETERSALGTTRANAEVKALRKRFDKLLTQIKSSDKLDPLIIESMTTELEHINGRLENVSGHLSERLSDLAGTVDAHEGLLAEHSEKFEEHKEKFDGHSVRIERATTSAETASEGVHSLNNRLNAAFKLPVKRFLLSVVIGLTAGFIWDSIPIGADAPKADGTMVFVAYPADSWLVAILAGVVAFAIAFGILLVVVPRKSKTQVDKNTTETTSTRSIPTPSDKARADSATLTKVIPTNAGAGIGTRS